MTGSLNPREINFRIQALQIDELLDGDRCLGGFKTSHTYYG